MGSLSIHLKSISQKCSSYQQLKKKKIARWNHVQIFEGPSNFTIAVTLSSVTGAGTRNFKAIWYPTGYTEIHFDDISSSTLTHLFFQKPAYVTVKGSIKASINNPFGRDSNRYRWIPLTNDSNAESVLNVIIYPRFLSRLSTLTHLNPKSRDSSFAHKSYLGWPIVLKCCTQTLICP